MEKNINGMVEQMNRINVTISAFKFLLVFAIVAMAGVCVTCIYLYASKVSEMQAKIFVLDNGSTFSAHAQDQSITRKDEVMDQVKVFHELMFNVPPSREMITRNLERALEMADKSAYRYYNDLQESGFYKRMTSTNSYQQIDIQSVDIDMSVYPYPVTVRAFQYITRESNISQYSLVTRCKVANAVRTPNNLHGLMIESFEVVENKMIETRNK